MLGHFTQSAQRKTTKVSQRVSAALACLPSRPLRETCRVQGSRFKVQGSRWLALDSGLEGRIECPFTFYISIFLHSQYHKKKKPPHPRAPSQKQPTLPPSSNQQPQSIIFSACTTPFSFTLSFFLLQLPAQGKSTRLNSSHV